MTIENLINIVRLGCQLTPAQSRAVSAQLERIPAMERTGFSIICRDIDSQVGDKRDGYGDGDGYGE